MRMQQLAFLNDRSRYGATLLVTLGNLNLTIPELLVSQEAERSLIMLKR
jgi:hypothetical protein